MTPTIETSVPPDSDTSSRTVSQRRRPFNGARNTLSVVGIISVLALFVGALVDIANIDPTSGGYEPPFADYTGDPIDWDADTYTTPTGMMTTGYVLDVHTDCTTGMISFEILGLISIDYRRLSDRALAVHQPDRACAERGFEPSF